MRAEIIATGDELLAGAVTDTNSAFLATELRRLGWLVARVCVVSDDEDAIAGALSEAVGRAGLIVVTGGLGPTRDDRTREAVARVAGVPLALDEVQLEALRARYEAHGRTMPESNRRQVYRPEGARPLANPNGTAPGFVASIGGSEVYVFPGVPSELRAMVSEGRPFPARDPMPEATLAIVGVSESLLDERIAALGLPEDVRVGTVSGGARIRVRLRSRRAEALAEARAKILAEFGPRALESGDADLAALVIDSARERGVRVACAESCTGGLVCAALTGVPGSSAVVLGGVVAYANEAKRAQLGVPEELLVAHGAVSAPVARAMAEGARRAFGADLAVSLTGIAGPGGATPEKPVGLVHLGLARAAGSYVLERRFGGTRARVRRAASQTALDMLRRAVLGLPDL